MRRDEHGKRRGPLQLICGFIAISALGAQAAQAGERRYPVTDFERVVVEGPYRVRLSVGAPSAAAARGSQRALDEVSLDVQNRTLRIRRNAQAWGGYPGRAVEPATIMLGTRLLRGVSVTGTGSLDVSGARGQRVELSLVGAGLLSAAGLDSDMLTVSARGSGIVLLAGRAATVTANVEGSASLDGSALTAQALTLGAATSGDIHMTAQRTATVNASGLGRVVVTGDIACTVSGSRSAEVGCGRAAR